MENSSDNIGSRIEPDHQVKNIYKSVQRIVFETIKDEYILNWTQLPRRHC